jgi:selenocysteine lyase/cysteine desulfurase
VHSSTGVELPVRKIADALRRINSGRGPGERVLLCVDGVHGLGVESVTMGTLGCDFFVAGCHKWLFGPRGTGIVWGDPDAWPAVGATIPSFTGGGPGAYMTPGGFHSFEHRWALREAFRFHQEIGKSRVEQRIKALNRRLKAGLAPMRHVTLKTPRSDALSAGLVCFAVRGLSPSAAVAALRRWRIIATVTPYTPSYVRLAPGLLNTRAEVDRALAAIRKLA